MGWTAIVMHASWAFLMFGLVLVLLSMGQANQEGEGVGINPSRDELLVQVGGGDDPGFSYTLRCHPTGGLHPKAEKACNQLDALFAAGQRPFTPVEPTTTCEPGYFSPEIGHITGTWAGQQIDANYRRDSGCEMNRWNALDEMLNVPLDMVIKM